MRIQAYVEEVRRAARYIRSRAPSARIDTAVILGSGIGGAVPRLGRRVVVPYEKIPAFPRTTVTGHHGKLVLGVAGAKGIAVLQGRFHYYEGHSMESIALPIRALEYLGLKTLIVTAAVGSTRTSLKPGQLVVVKDHLNFMGRNPLRGFHEEEFGEMFPDLADAYDLRLRRLALAACRRARIPASEGVYAAVGGPSYETPAEVRAFRLLGADVVGMSVVPEVIVARQMGLRVLAFSWVANLAAGLTRTALTHRDVLAMGQDAASRLKRVLDELLPSL